MTDELNTNAGAGPVEQGVRPCAWRVAASYWTQYDSIPSALLPPAEFPEPLYDQAALDAAVTAERERIKARLLGMDDAAAGRHSYYAHAAWVLFDRMT